MLPAQNVFVVPGHIDDDVAAVLDPLGNATHTALRYDVVGEDVLITGAGPIGIMASAIVRHIGARHVVVTDVNRYRLDMAAKHGASRVVDVSQEWPTSMEWLGKLMALMRNQPYNAGTLDGAQRAKETLALYRGQTCGVKYAEAVRSVDAYPTDIF